MLVRVVGVGLLICRGPTGTDKLCDELELLSECVDGWDGVGVDGWGGVGVDGWGGVGVDGWGGVGVGAAIGCFCC